MPDALSAILQRSRSLGFLGPGDPEAHRAHAAAFAAAWEARAPAPPESLCDLGAGGGVPGLVLGARWRGTSVVLLEAAVRRCDFLQEAVRTLGLTETVSVAHGRAESLARREDLQARFDLVTARSFGPPGAVAECATRLLRLGGVLLVAEPPDAQRSSERWPDDGLAQLGFGPAIPVSSGRNLVLIERSGPCPDLFPRRDGVPAKRPLF